MSLSPATDSRRVYLVASTGFPNYGDELIGAQWLRYLARHLPDAEVWLDSPSPANSELLLGHLHPKVRFVDTVFQLAWAAPSEEPWVVADFIDRATRFPGTVPRRAAGVDLLHEVDIFHVLGGGYINSIWPRHVALLAAGATLASDFDVRCAVTGAGLVPSAASRTLLARLTADFAVVDVRDAPSQALFAEGRVSDSGDDVFLELGPQLYDQRESRPVMLALQSDLVQGGIGAVAESAIACLDRWGVPGEDVGYVEAIPGPDRQVFDLISPFVPGMRFYPFTELWREGLPARSGQRWLTTRFHVHLVAAAAGAWGAVIPVTPGYYDVKHESLLARGSGWSLVRPGEAPPPAASAEPGFGGRVADYTARKQAVAADVYLG